MADQSSSIAPRRGEVALVTGASGGIGYELARLFARDGRDLVLIARSKERLTEIARDLAASFGVSATVIAKDLSDPGAPSEIRSELDSAKIGVDILVNNAGFAVYGPFRETDLRQELEMMQVNMVALTHLTKLLLPDMIARRSGKILNVASTAAFQPGPLMAIYYATKAYVLSFSEAIARELEGTGVTVTALCPGPTSTGFQKRAGVESLLFLRAALVMDPATVARAGHRGLERGDSLVIPGLTNRLLALGPRVLPRPWTTRILRALQERRR